MSMCERATRTRESSGGPTRVPVRYLPSTTGRLPLRIALARARRAIRRARCFFTARRRSTKATARMTTRTRMRRVDVSIPPPPDAPAAVATAEDHRDALTAVAPGRRDQRVLRELGVAGLEPVRADVAEAVVR